MEQEFFNSIFSLKEAINADERVVRLNGIDSEVKSNDEILILSYKKDLAEVNYEDALKHFSETSLEVKTAQKELYQAKLKLDEHPLTKKYNLAFKEVREMYKKMNNELFKPFSNHSCGEKHD